MNETDADAGLIIVEGCTWTFDGWTEKIAQSGVTALNLTLVGGTEGFAEALREFEHALSVIRADPDHFLLACSVADIRRAKAEHKTSIVFNFQNGRSVEDRLEHLLLFHELGLRSMQLTYNERNFIGDGCLEPANAGLSLFGRRVVTEMNRLGILIDLTHVGERTTLEAIERSEHPCVFSHSNPRRRAPNLRNITDEQIRACARRDGVIGLSPWGPICWTGGDNPPTMDDLIAHIEYVANLVGIDHAGIGTDSTTSTRLDHIAAHATEINTAYAAVTGTYVGRFGTGLQERYPVAAEDLPKVATRLRERGFSAVDTAKVMGGNFLRVWETVWGA
jgi:membrane dipeptidase